MLLPLFDIIWALIFWGLWIGGYFIPTHDQQLKTIRLLLDIGNVATIAALYIIAVDFPPRKRGRKRKALLEKLKTWADVPVPEWQGV